MPRLPFRGSLNFGRHAGGTEALAPKSRGFSALSTLSFANAKNQVAAIAAPLAVKGADTTARNSTPWSLIVGTTPK